MDSNDGRQRSFTELAHALQLDLQCPAPGTASALAANEPTYAPVDGDSFYQVCRDGERTAHLTRLAGRLLGAGCDARAATDLCLGWNHRNEPPLPEEKVRATVASIARTNARNHPPSEDPSTPLFDLRTASVARFLDREAPPREWVLEDCLPYGRAALLVATGGTGKSQLVLQLAYDVATGRQRFSPWAPGKTGSVLILSAEDEEEELHRRFRRLAHEDMASADGADVMAALRKNFFVVPRVGENNLMTRDAGREIERTTYVDRLAKTVSEMQDLRLIVIDPVSRFRGGDENAADDTTRFVEAIEHLVKQTGAAVLAVHPHEQVEFVVRRRIDPGRLAGLECAGRRCSPSFEFELRHVNPARQW